MSYRKKSMMINILSRWLTEDWDRVFVFPDQDLGRFDAGGPYRSRGRDSRRHEWEKQHLSTYNSC
jgi:hypothetical protein